MMDDEVCETARGLGNSLASANEAERFLHGTEWSETDSFVLENVIGNPGKRR